MRGSARARHSLNHYGLDWVPRLTAPIGYEHNMTLAQAKVNKIIVSNCFKIEPGRGCREQRGMVPRYVPPIPYPSRIPGTVAIREPFTLTHPRW